jgi:hypothetical protein
MFHYDQNNGTARPLLLVVLGVVVVVVVAVRCAVLRCGLVGTGLLDGTGLGSVEMGKTGKLKGGKGTVQLPYDMKLNNGPLKKVKKRGDSKRKMLRKKAAAEKGENWSERKAVHVAKMSKKLEATKKAKKNWQ